MIKFFYVFGLLFLLLALYANFLARNFPRIPWDITIERPGGIRIVIPIMTSLVLSVVLTLLLNSFLPK